MVELRGVSKQYLYGARVLGATDLSVEDGEILALLGDAQSGKTTLLKVIADVTDCDGEVLINGQKLSQKPDGVAMIFDDLAVFENRTFRYNLEFPLKIRGYSAQEREARISGAAERLGIVACLGKRVKKADLIDVKRLALARLLIRDITVALIDDITRGLDRTDAEKLWRETAEILSELSAKGATVIYSTENISEALSISDRIAVLHQGEIKQVGTYEQIYRTPSNVWAAQAVGDFHFERAKLSEEEGKLKLVLGVETPVSVACEVKLDAECLREKTLTSYIGKTVYAGWRASDFAEKGDRYEDVRYAVKDETGYTLITQNCRVKSAKKQDKVCTLPKIEKALLFDFTNENSIMRRV